MLHKRLEYRVGHAAYKGAREYQQDAIRIWPAANEAAGGLPSVLAVLSDGMGGHVSGEIASAIACQESIQYFAQSNAGLGARLEGCLEAANASIQREIDGNPRLSGMGCTLIAAYLDQSGVSWVSVGDSIMYLYRNRQLYRLNDDHSLGGLLDKQVKAQVISSEEAQASPYRRSLRSALTGARIPIVDLEAAPNQLTVGDWLLIASDGLETLSPETIANLLAQNAHREPQVVVDRLLHEVRRRNLQNQDNTSIIAVSVEAVEVEKTLQLRTPPVQRAEPEPSTDPTEILPSMRRGELLAKAAAESKSSRTQPLGLERQRSGFAGRLAAIAVLAIVVAGAIYYVQNGGKLPQWPTPPTSPAKPETAAPTGGEKP